jgi:hypothetical protein
MNSLTDLLFAHPILPDRYTGEGELVLGLTEHAVSLSEAMAGAQTFILLARRGFCRSAAAGFDLESAARDRICPGPPCLRVHPTDRLVRSMLGSWGWGGCPLFEVELPASFSISCL